MDQLNRKKSSLTPVLLLILLVALVAAAVYVYSKKTVLDETAIQETQLEQSQVAPEPTPPAVQEEAPEVVVETKKLDIGQPETPLPSASISDPAVAAMMTPRSLGDVNAPVKVVEYASLTCSHCGAFHRENFEQFKANYIDTGRVHYTFKEFPLNQPALDASQILRCMPEDKYMNFMNLLFSEQDKWAYAENYKDILRQNAKLGGMTDEQFDACLANEGLKNAIAADMKAASEQYKVSSTPSFVFNGGQRVLVGNQPLTEFDKAINEVNSAPAAAPVSVPAPEQPTPAAPVNSTLAGEPSDATAPPVDATGGESPEATAAGAAVEATGEEPDATPVAE